MQQQVPEGMVAGGVAYDQAVSRCQQEVRLQLPGDSGSSALLTLVD